MTLYLYYSLLSLSVLETCAALVRGGKVHICLLYLRTLAGLTGCGLVFVLAGRPPLFGPFEALAALTGITGVLALTFGRGLERPRLFYLLSAVLALGMLALQWPASMDLNPDYYMYQDLWVTLFFLFRLLAVGFLAHAGVQSLSGMELGSDRAVLWAGSRNTLLVGTCIYLAGEWSGSLWCLNWLGDSWQWSRGFFRASVLFLLVMAAFHLPMPKKGSLHPLYKGTAGALPGLFGLYMIFFH